MSCYFHVPKEKSKKLEAIGIKITFVGYCENYKSFRIYIHVQRKVEISRDVIFDEDVTLEKQGTFLCLLLLRRMMTWIF